MVVTVWSVLGGHELKKSHQGTLEYRDEPPTMSLYDFDSIWVDWEGFGYINMQIFYKFLLLATF